MSDAFESVKRGLTEALAYAEGKTEGAVAHEITVPATPDVKAIRSKTRLSQAQFAASIGVSPGTLKGWEQGRRRPEGPARVLLALVDRKPTLIRETLSSLRKSTAHPASITAKTGETCPESGMWTAVGTPSTTAPIAKGDPMPPHGGKAVKWRLTGRDVAKSSHLRAG